MKRALLILLLLLPVILYAQEPAMQDLAKSLDAQMKALKNAQATGDKKVMGRCYGNIGSTYLDIARLPSENVQPSALVSDDKKENLKRSMENSQKSIELADAVGDIDQLKTSYQNLYTAQRMSGKIKDALGTMGKIQALKHAILSPNKLKEIELRQAEYEHQKREDSIKKQQQVAEQKIKEQQQLVAQQQQQLQQSKQTLTAAQMEKDKVSKALQKTETDLTAEKSYSEEKARQLTQIDSEKALADAHVQLQQSKLQLQQNELHMKDQALEQRKREQVFYIMGIVILLAFAVMVYRNFAAQKKFNMALVNEKKRSEELLLNILPAEVAGELIEKGFADAKQFYDVTVLFTDFVNFTSVAEKMSPQQLVGELHICFKAFDVILSKYQVEKIKTVGDAYMAVSGLPVANPDHASDVIAAAIEIRDFMAARKVEMGSSTFGIRIGINSGNVVAGIVGVRKFSYDIWGDTVNIAARMEQNSEEGKINISDSTYQLVKEKYPCLYRGKIEAKNKGSIDMYFISA